MQEGRASVTDEKPHEQEESMKLLEAKSAIIYGAGGSIGGAVSRAFAREGARVFLTGRALEKLVAVASDIHSSGGAADVAQVMRWTRKQWMRTGTPWRHKRAASTYPST
jgi:NAD(P)-dependent dehydrogenase (short-subunit alcohol dehydrogenase family)